MIVLTAGGKVEFIENNLDAMAIITSVGDTGYLPIRNEMKNRRISGMIIKAVIDISCDAILSLIFDLNKLFTLKFF